MSNCLYIDFLLRLDRFYNTRPKLATLRLVPYVVLTESSNKV